MSEHSKMQQLGQTAAGGPSLERRRLLKASAIAAPIIATLPSGAALANASASQCIIKDYKDTHASGTAGFTTTPSADTYLRVPATKFTATKDSGVKTIYKVGAIYYDDFDGKEFDITGWTLAPTDGEPGFVLRVFVPYDDATNTINSETPTDVEKASPGYWPANKLSQGDNMALTGSCLTSINPNLA